MAAPQTAVEQPPAEAAAAPQLRLVEDRLVAIESDMRHAAARADLEALKAQLTVLQAELQALQAKLDTIQEATQAKLDAMHARLDGMATKADLADLRADVEAKLSSNLRWTIGSTVTAVAVVFGIVRFMG